MCSCFLPRTCENIKCVLFQRLPYLPVPCYAVHVCHWNQAISIASGWVDLKDPDSLLPLCLCSHFHVVTGTKGRIKAALPLKPDCFLLSSVSKGYAEENRLFSVCFWSFPLNNKGTALGPIQRSHHFNHGATTVLLLRLSWSNTVCLDSCQPDGRRIAAAVVNKGVSAPIAHLHHADLAPHIKT